MYTYYGPRQIWLQLAAKRVDEHGNKHVRSMFDEDRHTVARLPDDTCINMKEGSAVEQDGFALTAVQPRGRLRHPLAQVTAEEEHAVLHVVSVTGTRLLHIPPPCMVCSVRRLVTRLHESQMDRRVQSRQQVYYNPRQTWTPTCLIESTCMRAGPHSTRTTPVRATTTTKTSVRRHAMASTFAFATTLTRGGGVF